MKPLSKINFLTKGFFLIQIVLPLVVLQSIHFNLFDYYFSNHFLDFNSALPIQLYTIFMAVRAINALLIIANHKIKRAYFHFIILSFLEFLFFSISYFEGYSYAAYTDVGHLASIIDFNFLSLLIFHILIIGASVFVWKNMEEGKHMNFFIKSSFYLIIPFIFWFTFSASFKYVGENTCANILRISESRANGKMEKENKLLGLNISSLAAFDEYSFLPSKNYIVYVMDFQCETCWRGIENVKKFKEEKEIEDVVFFDISPAEAREELMMAFGLIEKFQVKDIPDNILNYTTTVPAMLVVDDLIIKKAFLNNIPCVYEMTDYLMEL